MGPLSTHVLKSIMAKHKMVQITKTEIKPGMLVVCNTLADAQVYRVKAVNNFSVALVYDTPDGEAEGGNLDYSLLFHPTSEQIDNMPVQPTSRNGTMKDPYFVAQYGNTFTIVDKAAWDGTQYKTAIYGHTLDVLRKREENRPIGTDANGNTTFEKVQPYKDAKIMEWDEAYPIYEAAQKAKYIGAVQQVTQHRFTYLLEVLPPTKWVRRSGQESFMMSEFLTGNITTIVVRLGTDYYEFNDAATLTHDAIVDKVRAAVKAGTIEDHRGDTPTY